MLNRGRLRPSARIIMGCRRAALIRLWRGQSRRPAWLGSGGAEPALVNTGQVITDIQVRHPALCWMAATLDGRIQGRDGVFEAKFMLPWSFSEGAAAEKYMP